MPWGEPQVPRPPIVVGDARLAVEIIKAPQKPLAEAYHPADSAVALGVRQVFRIEALEGKVRQLEFEKRRLKREKRALEQENVRLRRRRYA